MTPSLADYLKARAECEIRRWQHEEMERKAQEAKKREAQARKGKPGAAKPVSKTPVTPPKARRHRPVMLPRP